MANDPKRPNAPAVAAPVTVTDAPAAAPQPPAPAPAAALSVMFKKPTYQSKDAGTRRLAEVSIIGAIHPTLAVGGIGLALKNGTLTVYMPGARFGGEKYISPAPKLLRDPDTGETFMTTSRAGEKTIAALESAIVDAWAAANHSHADPNVAFDKLIPLSL